MGETKAATDGGSASGESSKPSAKLLTAGDRRLLKVELREGETTYVSWKKLMKEASKGNCSLVSVIDAPPPNANPNLESRIAPGQQPVEGETVDQPHSNRFNAVIEKIERLYMGRDSSDGEELDGAPDDDEYDTEDSFIDDVELDEYFEVDDSAIKHDGFFVNKGELERIAPSTTTTSNKQPKKRKRKESAKPCGDVVDVSSKQAKIAKTVGGKDHFESNRDTFLSSVVTSSSEASFNSLAVGNDSSSSSSSSAAVFGLYQCREDLRHSDCSKCIQNSVDQITLLCPYSYGASLQLEGCFLRYETNDFLGRQDTSLRYKKCSTKSVENDYDFFKRRDDVLSDLESTQLGYKVSRSGLVEGYAQCVGDLSPSDCTACLAESVGKLKNLCGSAVAAEVYLAQCYAHYWGSGYYDFSSDPTNGDNVGKSIAIIVGVIAGFAILVILLSLCRNNTH